MILFDVILLALQGLVCALEEKERGEDPTTMIEAAEHYMKIAIDMDTAHEMSRSIEIIRKNVEMIKNA